MLETVHVAVWILLAGAALIGGAVVAVANIKGVSISSEAKTLETDAGTVLMAVETKVKTFDANLFNSIKTLEAEGKAEVGSAVKYLESVTGVVLAKVKAAV